MEEEEVGNSSTFPYFLFRHNDKEFSSLTVFSHKSSWMFIFSLSLAMLTPLSYVFLKVKGDCVIQWLVPFCWINLLPFPVGKQGNGRMLSLDLFQMKHRRKFCSFLAPVLIWFTMLHIEEQVLDFGWKINSIVSDWSQVFFSCCYLPYGRHGVRWLSLVSF